MAIPYRLAFLLSAVLGSGVCPAAGPDELWEITTQMEMQGMSMPGSTQQVCQPANSAYDPSRGDNQAECSMSEVKTVGNRTSWKMRCSGEEEMEGEGEMLQTAEAMKGTMRVISDGEEMTMKMSGRRVGSCSAAAAQKKTEAMVADLQAQANAGKREACAGFVNIHAQDGGMGNKLPEEFADNGMCADAKPELCAQARARAASFAGYPAYTQGKGWVLAACNIELEPARKTLCTQATSARQFGFLRNHCPVEAAAARTRHCQGFGRGYTSDSSHPYAALCR